jgi:hypothetical protein
MERWGGYRGGGLKGKPLVGFCSCVHCFLRLNISKAVMAVK